MKKACAAGLTAVMLLTGCSSGQDTSGEIQLPIYGASEVKYEIATAEYMDLSETTSTGVTIGYPYATYLTYPADALVMSFDALKGKTVTEGEVLAVLDSSDLDYDISNQQTIVDSAYEASLSGSQAAALQYQIEQSKLDMLLEEKESYTITAPFDGIITQTNAAVEGDEVTEGELCCAVSETSKTTIYLDGSGASQFKYGQSVQVKVDSETFDAVVAEAPDVAPATAYGSSAERVVFDIGSENMEYLLENNAMAISSGWATVYVTTERKNVLAVPDSAVKSSGTESYVTIVDGTERYRLKVTVGVSLGGYTEIINGISEGDIVLAEGSGIYSS